MDRKKILFINGQSREVADIFIGMAPEGDRYDIACIPFSASEAEKIKAFEGVEYFVLHPATLPGSLMRQAKSLKLIQLLTAGYDKVDIKAAAELGIPVATNGGANAWAVSEHAVALILALYKKLLACDASVRAGGWRKPITGFNTFELSGKTVGIIGAGNIGRKVANRLKPFETEIVYHDQFRAEDIEKNLGARKVELDELVRVADIITLHAPLLDSTRGMFNQERFAAMKKTALFINTSRSELVDEAALVDVLQTRRIGGAGIDVFPEEPIRKDHPLIQLDNVILTPHSAGHSYEGWWRRSRSAWHNITKMTAGEKPDYVVR